MHVASKCIDRSLSTFFFGWVIGPVSGGFGDEMVESGLGRSKSAAPTIATPSFFCFTAAGAVISLCFVWVLV
jgi:hypothetical protein